MAQRGVKLRLRRCAVRFCAASVFAWEVSAGVNAASRWGAGRLAAPTRLGLQYWIYKVCGIVRRNYVRDIVLPCCFAWPWRKVICVRREPWSTRCVSLGSTRNRLHYALAMLLLRSSIKITNLQPRGAMIGNLFETLPGWHLSLGMVGHGGDQDAPGDGDGGAQGTRWSRSCGHGCRPFLEQAQQRKTVCSLFLRPQRVASSAAATWPGTVLTRTALKKPKGLDGKGQWLMEDDWGYVNPMPLKRKKGQQAYTGWEIYFLLRNGRGLLTGLTDQLAEARTPQFILHVTLHCQHCTKTDTSET